MRSKAATNSTAKCKVAAGKVRSGNGANEPEQIWSAAMNRKDNGATNAAISPPQASAPSWARYIDSRLKQFSLR